MGGVALANTGLVPGVRTSLARRRGLAVAVLLTLPWLGSACTASAKNAQAGPRSSPHLRQDPSFRLVHLYKNSALVPSTIAREAPFLPGNKLAFATIASTGCEEYPTRLLAASDHRWVFAMKYFSACLDDSHWAVPVIQLLGTTPDLTQRTQIVLRYPDGYVQTLTCQAGGKLCRRTDHKARR